MALAIVLVLGCACVFAVFTSNEGESADGECFEIDGLGYEITSGENVKVISYTGILTDVEMPETVTYHGKTYTVTSLEENVFRMNKEIKSVTLPKKLTSMDDSRPIPKNIGVYGHGDFAYGD